MVIWLWCLFIIIWRVFTLFQVKQMLKRTLVEGHLSGFFLSWFSQQSLFLTYFGEMKRYGKCPWCFLDYSSITKFCFVLVVTECWDWKCSFSHKTVLINAVDGKHRKLFGLISHKAVLINAVDGIHRKQAFFHNNSEIMF